MGPPIAYHPVRMVDTGAVEAAVAALRAGQVIGLPTETVYGLAGDASNPDAVRRIFTIKGRPATHPVIVHIASLDEMSRWARDIPPAAMALAERHWPGPLTLVLPRAPQTPLEVTGGQDSVALRVPSHPVAQAVLRAFGGGLAAPSANRYGRVSPTTAAHVRDDLGDDVAIVLDGGPSDVGIESTIVSCLNGRVTVLRPGVIGADAIAATVGTLDAPDATMPRVPGRVESHYAPRTPVQLVDEDALDGAVLAHVQAGRRVAILARSGQTEHAPVDAQPVSDNDAGLVIVGAADAVTYGRELYAHLRRLDHTDADVIVIARPPRGDDWAAVHDRLGRAATR